jgi:hypothetical protein
VGFNESITPPAHVRLAEQAYQSLTAKVTANRMDFLGRARTSTDGGWSRLYTRWTSMDGPVLTKPLLYP